MPSPRQFDPIVSTILFRATLVLRGGTLPSSTCIVRVYFDFIGCNVHLSVPLSSRGGMGTVSKIAKWRYSRYHNPRVGSCEYALVAIEAYQQV